MDNRPIGIFDSGVGGITVYKEIKKILPNEDYIYIGDTSRFPYGNKSKEIIINIAKQIIQYFINNNVKLVVIACGTATSQALEELQKEFEIPIIGIIEPTIIQKIDEKTKSVGIIATKGTVQSKAWEKAIYNKNKNVLIYSKATPLLAPMAEEGWINNNVAKEAISEYLKEFKNLQLEKLILGCTHYPLFKEIIQQELEGKVEIINIGEQIAKYLQKYLIEMDLQSSKEEGTESINLTDINCNFVDIAENLLGRKIEIKKINL